MHVKSSTTLVRYKSNDIQTTATFGACNEYDAVCIQFAWMRFTEDSDK